MNDALAALWCPHGHIRRLVPSAGSLTVAPSPLSSAVSRLVLCGFSVSGQVSTLLPFVGGGLLSSIGWLLGYSQLEGRGKLLLKPLSIKPRAGDTVPNKSD